MTDPTPLPPKDVPLRRTALYDFHRRHGGHIVPFAGWEMPLYYTSILAEHRAVREAVGLFDVSHMGILTVDGAHAADLLGRRTTANVPALTPEQVRYTFLLESTGYIVDDLLVSRIDTGEELTRSFVTVPNASRADEIEEILRQHRGPDTTIGRWNGPVALLAVQGPKSRAVLESLYPWDLSGLPFYHVRFFPKKEGTGPRAGRLGLHLPTALGEWLMVSRTGYTGELGYEVFVPASEADALAERLVAAGAVPCGLGCRDTLRLEKGYLLSGQEFHRDHTPLEAGQERFVDFDHVFVGSTVLAKEKAEGPKRRLVGIELTEPGAIPRHGTPIRSGGAPVTEATSGGLSPTLGKGIALAYLPPELTAPGTALTLDIRGREAAGQVVPLPFLKSSRPRT
ncbi:MAG TPA: glycine cleavage system aminomethyltransferase GcvT [Thermoplasmata archaeon]|nr:glycine cleavage system aminomethyltransferase GcvT [Thermoplasmata archaeon]